MTEYFQISTIGNVYRAHGAAVEGGLGEGKSVSWEDERTKGEVRECKPTKNMFLNSDLLKLCLKKNTTSLIYSLTKLYFAIIKLALQGNGVTI